MTSAPDAALRKPEWIRNINLAAVTEPFGVEWICTATTDFDGVGDLKNPFNERRSVVVGRDGQEYPPDCGRRMMALLSQPAAAPAPAPPHARREPAPPACGPLCRARPGRRLPQPHRLLKRGGGRRGGCRS